MLVDFIPYYECYSFIFMAVTIMAGEKIGAEKNYM